MKEFYYLNAAGEKVGPLPLSDATAHRVTATTMVWLPGMTTWQPAKEVPAVMACIIPSAPQPPQTPPAPGFGGYAAQQPQVLSNKPQNFLWLGIVTTLLCCLPAGIVSIIYATKVDNLWNTGDHQGAIDASNNAKTWGFVSVGLGFVLFIIGFIVGLAGA
ncbi:MAG: DUF4339 domain-containing protein [Bacteroidales bacterium]|nr:DUF4339 domain-containing protein [Bacteroidales bacterium]